MCVCMEEFACMHVRVYVSTSPTRQTLYIYIYTYKNNGSRTDIRVPLVHILHVRNKHSLLFRTMYVYIHTYIAHITKHEEHTYRIAR